MYPQGYPAEMTPMQARHDGQPGQPGGPTVVSYTTVNINSEPHMDHIIWSLFNFVYVNPFFLGLAGLIYSIKARDRRVVGDLQGARDYASKARSLNIAATVLGSIIFITGLSLSIVAAKNVYEAVIYFNKARSIYEYEKNRRHGYHG